MHSVANLKSGSKYILGLFATAFLASFIFPSQKINAGVTDTGRDLSQEINEVYSPDQPSPVQEEFIEPPTSTADAKPSSSSSNIFLSSINFVGNNLYSDDKLISSFNNLIGKNVTFEEVGEAVKKIESLYKDNGYILTSAFLPSQSFDSGSVTVQVVEGYLDSYIVRGGTRGNRNYVRNMLSPLDSAIKESKAFNFNTLEKQLLLIRDFNSVNFKSTLAKGSKFGSSTLYIDLKPNAISTGVTADTWISQKIGDYKVNTYAQIITPTTTPLKVFLSGTSSFPGELKFNDNRLTQSGQRSAYGNISAPISTGGLVANASYAMSDSRSNDIGSTNSSIWTEGSSENISIGIEKPIHVGRTSMTKIGLTGTHQNSEDNLYINNHQSQNVSANKIRALRLNLDGYSSDSSGSNQYSLQLSRNLDILDNDLGTWEVHSNPAVANEDESWMTSKFFLSRNQRLGNSNSMISFKTQGQYASAPVPVPEQIGYGGQSFGRGFDSNQILGDIGAMGSVELSNVFFAGNSTFTPFAFYDYGWTKRLETIDLDDEHASTYGFGFRTTLSNTFDLDAGVGIPINSSIDSVSGEWKDANYFIKGGFRF